MEPEKEYCVVVFPIQAQREFLVMVKIVHLTSHLQIHKHDVSYMSLRQSIFFGFVFGSLQDAEI